METPHLPQIGALGFFRPDPGGPRSPNIVRELCGSVVFVRELVSGKVVELALKDWMSAREMCSETERLIDTGKFDRADIEARTRAMTAAFACYKDPLPSLTPVIDAVTQPREPQNQIPNANGQAGDKASSCSSPRVEAPVNKSAEAGRPNSSGSGLPELMFDTFLPALV